MLRWEGARRGAKPLLGRSPLGREALHFEIELFALEGEAFFLEPPRRPLGGVLVEVFLHLREQSPTLDVHPERRQEKPAEGQAQRESGVGDRRERDPEGSEEGTDRGEQMPRGEMLPVDQRRPLGERMRRRAAR